MVSILASLGSRWAELYGDARFARITMGGALRGFSLRSDHDGGLWGERSEAAGGAAAEQKNRRRGTLAAFILRSGRDSNSRYAFGAHTLSSEF